MNMSDHAGLRYRLSIIGDSCSMHYPENALMIPFIKEIRSCSDGSY